jgi:hypothetical protein
MKANEEHGSRNDAASDQIRRGYARPTMKPIGRLEDLTASGTGGIMEMAHGSSGSIFSQA